MSEEVEETMKVKPWTVEEENQLCEMVEAGCSLREISSELKKSSEAVWGKMKRLDIEVDKQQSVGFRLSTTTEIFPFFRPLKLWQSNFAFVFPKIN